MQYNALCHSLQLARPTKSPRSKNQKISKQTKTPREPKPFSKPKIFTEKRDLRPQNPSLLSLSSSALLPSLQILNIPDKRLLVQQTRKPALSFQHTQIPQAELTKTLIHQIDRRGNVQTNGRGVDEGDEVRWVRVRRGRRRRRDQ